MWRNKKKKKKKKNKANVKIGSIGGGNVGLGNASAGVTTLSSLVTNIGTSGATTVNIGSTGTTGSSMVNIGLGATGINIGTGSTGTVTIGNANGVVRLNGPLTLGSAPSSSTQLGGQQTATFISFSSPGNIGYVTLSAGSWIIFGNLYFGTTTTFRELSISSVSGSIEWAAINSSPGSGVGALSLIRGVNIATSTTFYLYANSVPAITTSNWTLYTLRVG